MKSGKNDKYTASAELPPPTSDSVYPASTATVATSAWPGLTTDGIHAYASQRHRLSLRPRSVARLLEDAEFVFDPKPRLQAYLRGLGSLRRQATVYEHEGDFRDSICHVYQVCSCSLALENIPQHPEFEKACNHETIKRTLVHNSHEAIKSMRRLKPILKNNYEQAMQDQIKSIGKSASSLNLKIRSEGLHGHTTAVAFPAEEEVGRRPFIQNWLEPLHTRAVFLRRVKGFNSDSSSSSSRNDSNSTSAKLLTSLSLPSVKPAYAPQSHHESLANDWVTNTDLSSSGRRKVSDDLIKVDRSLLAHPASTVRDDPRGDRNIFTHWSPTAAPSSYADDTRLLGLPLAESLHASAMSNSHRSIPPRAAFGIPYAPTGQIPRYVQPQPSNEHLPNLQQIHQITTRVVPVIWPENSALSECPDSASHTSGTRGSRATAKHSVLELLHSPVKPSKVPLANCQDRWSLPLSASRPPSLSHHNKPAGVRDESSAPPFAKTEAGVPLRPILVPADLIETFSAIALPNTERNTETCGLILGKLFRNAFTVSALMIPKQWGTSDMCVAEQEEDVLEVCDRKDAIVLGWIHTHPQHPCFLSSMDLHTHCSYQTMLPEAIAIVVAPLADRNVGIFRLTDPPGTAIVGQCVDPRPFHPHPDLPIYTDVDVYHVILRDQMPFEVVDVR